MYLRCCVIHRQYQNKSLRKEFKIEFKTFLDFVEKVLNVAIALVDTITLSQSCWEPHVATKANPLGDYGI